MLFARAIVPSLAAIMVLAQCQSTTTATAPASTQQAPVTTISSSNGGDIFNAYRVQNGKSASRPSAALNRAANAHARDMAANNFMGHTSSNGDKVRDRARKQGYRACWIAENVAKGQGSANEVMAQWMGSPPHRKNMLNSKSVEYGLARGPANAWVLVLASPGCG